MDKREFVERCLKTPGVPDDIAFVVYSKLWRMHVDSTRPAGDGDDAKVHSSAPPEGARDTPFKERLRPGMVVRYRRGADAGRDAEFAMVVCPGSIVAVDDGRFRGLDGGVGGGRVDVAQGILCSVVERAVLKNSFLVNVWQHVVVSVDEMEAEAILQYDPATRYYFLDV
jgi:kinesin family member 2/24